MELALDEAGAWNNGYDEFDEIDAMSLTSSTEATPWVESAHTGSRASSSSLSWQYRGLSSSKVTSLCDLQCLSESVVPCPCVYSIGFFFPHLHSNMKTSAATSRTNAAGYRCSSCVCSSCRPAESNAALSARNRMLLRSNAPPADEQIGHIQGARNRLSKRLDVLEEQIHAYMSTLFDLQKEKTKMETALKEYKLILSPARRIPVELWYNTFQMCQSDAADSSSSSLSTAVVPWSLTQVCCRWRAIVNNMHQL